MWSKQSAPQLVKMLFGHTCIEDNVGEMPYLPYNVPENNLFHMISFLMIGDS